jgi:uncharacterized membrane protein YeaQ/YmgE (transglycosylase-associated protein family)
MAGICADIVCNATATRRHITLALANGALVHSEVCKHVAPRVERKDEHMGILAWIVVGLIGGVIAKMIVPGNDPGGGGIGGLVVTILLGIVGAFVGGFLAVAMGISDGVNNFDLGTILLSIVGAVIILVLYHALMRGGRSAHA